MKRRWITTFVALIILCLSYTVVYAEKIELIYDGETHLYEFVPISLYINGVLTETTVMPPIQIHQSVLVPAREVFEKMNAEVSWKPQEKKVYLTKADQLIVLEINSNEAWVNGEIKSLVVPAKLINNKVMIPIRFMSEALGFDVKWEGKTKSIFINEMVNEPPITDSNETITDENGYITDNPGDIYDPNQEDNYLGDDGLIVESPIESIFTHMTYDTNLNAIIIDKVEGLEAQSITVNEDYHNRQLLISLPNNYRDYFGVGTWKSETSSIREVTFNHYDLSQLVIKTDTVKALNIYEYEDKIYLQCVTPREKYGRIVYIDPGHGLKDSGTTYGSLYEKDFTLALGRGLYQLLEQNPSIKVYTTRNDDSFLTLSERTTLANEIDPDLFLSIHINWADNFKAKGTETYYTEKSDTRNQIFAEMVQKALVDSFGTTNRGVKASNYYVTKNTNAPAILIEIGFLSNEADRQMMTSSDFVQKYTTIVYKCILDYYAQGLNY